jgi:hypothetical protein
MLPTPPQLEPDIKPDEFLSSLLSGWLLWVVVAFIVILVAGLLFYPHKRKKIVPIPPTAEEISIGKIDALLATSPNLRKSATELSLIIREYLSGCSEDPALFETHQEFCRRADALLTLPLAVQVPVRELLEKMAQLKYEPETPENLELARDLASRSKDLIKQMGEISRAASQEKPTPGNQQ